MSFLAALAQKQKLAFFLIFLLGFLLFAYVNINNVANSDGYLYFVTANVFMDQGLTAATQQFSWPFYSILLGSISSHLHISLGQATLILTWLLYFFLIYSFIDLIKELGGKRQEQLIGGLLLVTLPLVNEYLEYVIRDHGYVAFLIFGVCQLVKFANRPAFLYSFLWSVSVIIASLFRIEALVIMPVTSLILVALPANNLQRLFKPLRINAPLLFLFAVAGLFYLSAHTITTDINFTRFHDLANWISALANQSYGLYVQKSEWVATSLSKAMKPERMWIIFLGGFGFFILFKLATGLTLLNCIGCYWHSKINKFFWSDKRWWIIYWLIAVLIITIIFYVALHYFLSQRYLLPLIITLLLMATFGLSGLLNYLKDNPPSQRMLIILLTASFAYNMLDILLTFGTTKTYIIQATTWTNEHIDSESPVFINHVPTAYYSHRLTQDQFATIENTHSALSNAKIVRELKTKKYDYAFLHISRRNKQLVQMMANVPNFKPLASFANEKGDSIVVYKID